MPVEPVRSSLADGTPLAWQRVTDLPDYVYFNHSIHIAKGVGCSVEVVGLYTLIYLIGRSPPAVQPLIFLAALVMLGVIATYVMKVGRGPTLVRLFAAAGVLWLFILLALGSLDPLTRVAYPVTQAHD
jgi:hypothetical protein